MGQPLCRMLKDSVAYNRTPGFQQLYSIMLKEAVDHPLSTKYIYSASENTYAVNISIFTSLGLVCV